MHPINRNDDGSGAPLLLSYGDVARWLGIKLGTLYALVHENRIPHVRIGARSVRFKRDDLLEWIAARTIGAKAVQR
jgi:excisionase family DNA binding protein